MVCYVQTMQKSIFFSVGEPSGDQHAARLIRSLAQAAPGLHTRGFGGPEMKNAGCEVELDLTEHAVVGLLEVLPKIREFFRFADQAEAVFKAGDVDAVMLVDFPGFNWHIAKRAKKYGLPVFYYCPPQLWAWAPWRIRKMRRNVDHVLSVLPFENDYFSQRGLDSTFVGHPFFDSVASKKLDDQLLTQLRQRTQEGRTLVAVLPGSRTHEVRANWPLMLQAIRMLHQRFPSVRFQVAAYRDHQCLWCREQLMDEDQGLPIDFFVNRTSEVVEVSTCAMMVSGSVSLELMARRTPAAVIYRVGRFLHTVGKRLIQVESLTLPNLMAGRKVFPEFVSVGNEGPAVEFLCESVGAMLGDAFYRQQLMAELEKLCSAYANTGASDRAAARLTELLGLENSSVARIAA